MKLKTGIKSINLFNITKKLFLIIAVTLSSFTKVTSQELICKQLSFPQGLSSHLVQDIKEDKWGNIWIGTDNGLNRIMGNEIFIYKKNAADSSSLQSNNIKQIIRDSKERIWTFDNNLAYIYNTTNDKFDVLTQNNQKVNVHRASKMGNNLLLATNNTIYIYDTVKDTITNEITVGKTIIRSLNPINDSIVIINNFNKSLFSVNLNTGKSKFQLTSKFIADSPIHADSKGKIWIAQYRNLNCYTWDGNKLVLEKTFNSHNSALTPYNITCIKEKDNKLWITTDGGGVQYINLDDFSIGFLMNNTQFQHNNLLSTLNILFDNDNNIWLGTVRSGVVFVKEVNISLLQTATMQSKAGLSNMVVLSITEDSEGIIWLATDGGGINSYNPNTKEVKQYPSTAGLKVNSVSNLNKSELVFSVYQKYIAKFNKNTGEIKILDLTNTENNQKVTNYDFLRYLYNHDLLTFYDLGHMRLNIFKKTLTPYTARNKNALPNLQFAVGDNKEHLYSFGEKGIYAFNKMDLDIFNIYAHTNNITNATIDKNGNIWFSDILNDLYLYDVNSKKSELILNTNLEEINTLIVDNNKDRLWYGSLNGIHCYDINSKKNYFLGEPDGVPVNKYISRVAYVSTAGDVYLGGINGLLIIHNDLKFNPKPNFEAILVSVNQDNNKVVLHYSEEKNPHIQAKWDYSLLELKIAPKGVNLFAKRLMKVDIVGTNNYSITTRSGVFEVPKLPIGDYTVNVSFRNINNKFTTPKQIATLTINGPWWRSPIAFYVLIFILLLIITLIYNMIYRRKKRKMNETYLLKRKKLSEQKLAFMTNISHELRTPLTLIHSPINRLMNIVSTEDRAYKEIKSIHKQTQKMISLIDMVLNIRCIEENETSLDVSSINITQWFVSNVTAFNDEYKNKNISLDYNIDIQNKEINLDSDKCSIILSNLLMNALKYSNSNTHVCVNCKEIANKLHIEVVDEGIGIDDSKTDELFKYFYQKNSKTSGFGIGLAYTKSLVLMHKGKIGAYSNKGAGSTFYFQIPYNLELKKVTIVETTDTQQDKNFINAEVPQHIVNNNTETITTHGSINTQNYTILIVDDNTDIIDYLKEELTPHFKNVYCSYNGEKALECIKTKLPDLVISDIMMPIMDGYQLCTEIKKNIEISHIPIILLTAKGDTSHQSHGYKLGADNYITKPFDIEMLFTVIKNVLSSRESIKKRFLNYNEVILPKDSTFSNADEKFMTQVNEFIISNLDNPELEIEAIHTHLKMSRLMFKNKFKAITNTSVNKYINSVRVERAKLFIEQGELSLSEIGYSVGFSSASYFSTVFKQVAGCSPKVYAETSQSNKN
ncbi:MAG: response regulator [Rikenellaceae bacterium]